ncbi:MAG TPA: glycoside hydrolase family 36 protein [Anaerolineales bacterium]|nr:glycoside hydrolase family 36 protein [Anaerolineales bacterium]
MELELENAYLRLSLDPVTSTWSLIGQGIDPPSVRDISMRVSYRRGRFRQGSLTDWSSAEFTEIETIPSPHGTLRQQHLHLGPDSNDLSTTLTFALPEGRPLLLWKVQLENLGEQPIAVERIELFRLGPKGGEIQFAGRSRTSKQSAPQAKDLGFFSNGWQSWSYCGTYGKGDHFRRSRLGPIRVPMNANAGTPRPGRAGHFASDMFGVLGDRELRTGTLLGFLSQREHFGSLEASMNTPRPLLNLWANGDGALLLPGASLSTDWACLEFVNLDDSSPLSSYLNAVARENGLDPTQAGQAAARDIPTGWCSWYHFSSQQLKGTVTAGNVLENLQALASQQPDLPLEVIQIDDGFETRVGDWSHFTPGFPQGVAPLAQEIQTQGLEAGLWLAPFIVHPKSGLAKVHPRWLLRGRLNRPVNAGFMWNTFTSALDLTQPEALAYACEVVQTAVHKWGFPYLKLDFLYAAALPGKYHDQTRTRAQVLRHGLEALRSAAGEQATLLGCSCPLGSAIGLVDAMRISADTAPDWYASFNRIEFLFKEEASLPSARNAVQNTLTRASLHRRWWTNDPDCLLLGKNTNLTLAEVRSVATAIALSGGSLLLSDNLPALPAERLQIAKVLLPLIGKSPRVPDWFDTTTPRRMRLDLENSTGKWHLLALFNWEDRPQDLTISLADFGLDPASITPDLYYARPFWGIESAYIPAGFSEALPMPGGELTLPGIPAHGVALLAVRRLRPGVPTYLGSDLHISQGLEVSAWEPATAGLNLQLQRPGRALGHLELSLPAPPKLAFLDQQPLSWQTHREHIYRFSVDFYQSAGLSVEW